VKEQFNFYFIRHGQTEHNAKHIISGQSIPLNHKGREEAKYLAKIIKEQGITFDEIISSPLKRAFETAQIATKSENIIIDENFKEMFFGSKNEGISLSEFKKQVFNPKLKYSSPSGTIYFIRNGEELRKYHQDTNKKYDYLSHSEGEAKSEVMERAKNGLKKIIKNNLQNEKRNFLIFTHAAFLRFLMSTINREIASEPIKNTEIIHIKYNYKTRKFTIEKRYKNK